MSRRLGAPCAGLGSSSSSCCWLPAAAMMTGRTRQRRTRGSAGTAIGVVDASPAGELACGQEITESVTLISDMDCDPVALIVTGDNVVLDRSTSRLLAVDLAVTGTGEWVAVALTGANRLTLFESQFAARGSVDLGGQPAMLIAP